MMGWQPKVLIWLVPAAMLLLALLKWPYGYYQFLRLVVCVSAAFISVEASNKDGISVWSIVFGAIALLYNPILPVHLTRGIWGPINVASAAAYLAHLGTSVFSRPR